MNKITLGFVALSASYAGPSLAADEVRSCSFAGTNCRNVLRN